MVSLYCTCMVLLNGVSILYLYGTTEWCLYTVPVWYYGKHSNGFEKAFCKVGVRVIHEYQC